MTIHPIQKGLESLLNAWQCRKTGDCCKRFISNGPRITKSEQVSIVQTLDGPEILEHLRSIGFTQDMVKENMENKGSLPIIKDQGTCVFLKNDECIIHQVKPKVCKDYPLVIEECDDKILIKVDLDCPRGSGIVQELINNRIPGWLPHGKPIEVKASYFYEELAREKFGDE